MLLLPLTHTQVKIGDFGFTKRLSGNKASMQVKRITHPRWVAPEVRQGKGRAGLGQDCRSLPRGKEGVAIVEV